MSAADRPLISMSEADLTAARDEYICHIYNRPGDPLNEDLKATVDLIDAERRARRMEVAS